MGKQLYLNNFESAFTSIVKDTPVTGTPATEIGYGILNLNNSTAAALANPTGGDFYLLTALKRSGSLESAIEIMKVTAVDTTTYPGECRITVLRAQEGTTALAYLVGDIMSLRWTKGSASSMIQAAEKDASGGVPGLTLFKLNLRNVAGSITSWLTNAATVARTWTMPDKDGTVAMTDDITGGTLAGSFTTLNVSGDAATVPIAKIRSTVANQPGMLMFKQHTDLHGFDLGLDGATGDGVWRAILNNVATEYFRVASANGLISSLGGFQITGPALLGYGTGAGGTVTQATSKSTAVTLNKPTGVITMHNAALASGAEVSFLVNNSVCVIGCTAVANQCDYTINTTNYQVRVGAVASGSFLIFVKNLSGITLTEALPISFILFNGSAS